MRRLAAAIAAIIVLWVALVGLSAAAVAKPLWAGHGVQGASQASNFTGMALSCGANCTFVGGTAGSIGTASATLSTGILSVAWSIKTTLTDSFGTQCNNYGAIFAIAGGSGALTNTAAAASGSYPGLCITATQAGVLNSPFTVAFTVTGSNSVTNVAMSCGVNCSFTSGLTNPIGTASATVSSGSFTGTWGLKTSGFDHTGTTGCNNYGTNLSIASATGVLSPSATAPAQSYPGVCITATQAFAAPYTQAFTVTGGSAPSFTAVSLPCASSCAFTSGSVALIGTASATLSSGSFAGTWGLKNSGFDHTGTAACNDYSADFTIVSTTGALSSTTGAPAQSYPGLCITATQSGIGGSPYTQAFNTVAGTAAATASTFDPARNTTGQVTLSPDKLTATMTAAGNNNDSVFTTKFLSSGKQVYRMTIGHCGTAGGGNCAVGFATSAVSSASGNILGQNTNSFGIYDNGIVWLNGGSAGPIGFTYGNGDTIDLAIDLTNKTIQAAKNGGALSSTVSVAALSSSTLSPAAQLFSQTDAQTFNGSTPGTFAGFTSWDSGIVAPVITLNPASPSIPDTTALGATVAGYTLSMSDNSPYISGPPVFAGPNFGGDPANVNNIYAIASTGATTGNIIVRSPGPGVGTGPLTENITLQATQGPTLSIASVSVTPSTFSVPTGTPPTLVGTISASCVGGSCASATFANATVAGNGCTSAQIADRTSFAVASNTNLNTAANITVAGARAIGIIVTLAGATNTGACFPVALTGNAGGALAGSILPTPPAGKQWVVDFDDEFSVSTVDAAKWQIFNNFTVTSGQYCNNDQVRLTVSGGLATFNTFDAAGTPCPSGTAGGAALISQNLYGNGYFEARLIGDPTGGGPAGGGGSGFWFDAQMASCGGNWAQNGFEADLMEYWNGTGHNNVIWNGYGPCTQSNDLTGAVISASDAFHVWGMRFDASTGLQFFKDGSQTSSLNDGSCSAGTPCSKPLQIFLNNNLNAGNPVSGQPMQVDWVRHYVLQ